MKNLLNIKSVIILYFIVINIIGLLSMYLDKEKSKRGKWRTPEATLLAIAALGGSIGSYIGMMKFRHKTKHLKFKIGIPAIIIIQAIIIGILYM